MLLHLCCLLFGVLVSQVTSSELTFELPDNEKLCFHEVIDKDVKCTLEYQVSAFHDIVVKKFPQLGSTGQYYSIGCCTFRDVPLKYLK